jgi:hypothetical protein
MVILSDEYIGSHAEHLALVVVLRLLLYGRTLVGMIVPLGLLG